LRKNTWVQAWLRDREAVAVAVYFFHLKVFSRSKGSRATKAAAYRSGERIRDERTGESYNYSHREDVADKDIVLPADIADQADMAWARDRSALWNAAEHAGRLRNSRLAREVLVILPPELTAVQRSNLVRRFSQELADQYRNAVDFAVHVRQRALESAQQAATQPRKIARGALTREQLNQKRNEWNKAHREEVNRKQRERYRKRVERKAAEKSSASRELQPPVEQARTLVPAARSEASVSLSSPPASAEQSVKNWLAYRERQQQLPAKESLNDWLAYRERQAQAQKSQAPAAARAHDPGKSGSGREGEDPERPTGKGRGRGAAL
jgi:hypothetical protein